MRRKVLVVAILIVAMLLQCVMPFTVVNAATGVVITLNNNLYKAVKAQLEEKGITATYIDVNGIIIISSDELDKVTSLNLENRDIDDLTGLDSFSKVTTLNLHANNLTTESNLQVLDALPLTDLDLSSNELESVRQISSFNSIEKADITDQRVVVREVISVDDSEESQSHEKTVTVQLPDILLEDGNQINPAWIINNFEVPSRLIISYTELVPTGVDDDTGETIYSEVTTYPEIDFENSFAAGSTDMVLKVARGDGSNYHALKGLIKFIVRVNDSTSRLANTQMDCYYAIVDEEETGIAFDDEHLYLAVKEQLTEEQEVNDDPDLKDVTDERDLYSRAYDEALIMVIDTNDIINHIPSLILHDKKIKDLRGLEEFVGLRKNLDISYNYITTVRRIVELEENKTKKEQELQAKYQKNLDGLKAVVTTYDAQREIWKEATKRLQKAREEYAGLTDAAARDAKVQEMQNYQNQIDDAQEEMDKAYELIQKYVQKLYKIYEKEYRMVTLLPESINHLSYEDLITADLATLKTYVSAIMTKISSIEKGDAFTSYEYWAITTLLSQWAESNGRSFKTTKVVNKIDPANPTGEPIETLEPIEDPITKFFEEVNKDETLNISDYEEFVYIFKCIDVLSQLEEYGLIKRFFEGTDENYIPEALEDIERFYEEKGYDLHFYNLLTKDTDADSDTFGKAIEVEIEGDYLSTGVDGEGYEINADELFPVHIGLDSSEYTGEVTTEYTLTLAHRQALSDTADISVYIVLPRTQILNMADNKVRTLKGMDTLTELKEFNAWKNMVHDISDVDWSKFNKLTVLNLGYNQISDISPLQVLRDIEDLNLSYNLLEGKFTFRLLNMKNLKRADFSHNQISDIQYVNDQYILKALGYDEDGDGVSEGYTVPQYLKRAGIELSFQYQTLEMDVTMIESGEPFVEFELPLIFRQIEKMDHERSSFGVDSLGGLVEPEGKTVKMRAPSLGEHTAVVSVEGRNGYEYTDQGIGYGTTCTIKMNVIDPSSINPDPTNPDPTNPDPTNPDPTNPDPTNPDPTNPDPTNPDPTNPDPTNPDPTNPDPTNPDPTNPDPTNPDPTNPDPTNPDPEIDFGYRVEDGYVYVYRPETTIEQFGLNLVDLHQYNVTVTDNSKASGKIGTGSVVTITSKDGEEVYAILEVVVKGDLNGDGEVDALDSGIARNVINDVTELVGVYKGAADINDDKAIDSLDSMLILQYRADRIISFDA